MIEIDLLRGKLERKYIIHSGSKLKKLKQWILANFTNTMNESPTNPYDRSVFPSQIIFLFSSEHQTSLEELETNPERFNDNVLMIPLLPGTMQLSIANFNHSISPAQKSHASAARSSYE